MSRPSVPAAADAWPQSVVHTTKSLGVICCHACHRLSPRALEGRPCPRCGAPLHQRKPGSVERTWAFLIAAMILNVPANLLPMTMTQSFAGSSQDTLLASVVYFWTSGSKGLALVVLVPSIVFPLLKMAALTMLLLSVHLRSCWRVRQKTRLYALLEAIGRWSMLDIFVVAMLTTLVRAGKLATIVPGPAALAFAGVVVTTMFASLSFDPRLLWDSLDANDD